MPQQGARRRESEGATRADRQETILVGLQEIAVSRDQKALVTIADDHQRLQLAAFALERWQRRHLGIALNAPTAEARCVVTDKKGVIIYSGEITYPGDYVRLNIQAQRP